MIELVVAGYLLTGTVCGEDAGRKFCRDIPAHAFGGKYACDRKHDDLIERFPETRPEAFGYRIDKGLHLSVSCDPIRRPAGA